MALALRVCAVQGAVTLLGAALAGLISGIPAAAAALYGGSAALVPTLYFGWRVTLRMPGATPEHVLGALYRGELVKIALSVLLLAGGAKWFGAQFAPLILTFSACLFAYWVALAARW